jgi:hypothetical protein
MANVTVSPGRAGPVVIAIQLETTDELPLQAKSVSVTLTNATASAEQAERTDDDQWQARMSAPSPGRWMLGLGISISDTDKVNIESPILIRWPHCTRTLRFDVSRLSLKLLASTPPSERTVNPRPWLTCGSA